MIIISGSDLSLTNGSVVEQLRLHGREAVARVSSLLGFAADIHVARHVDIDGIGQEASASSTDYMHTVDNARVLVRTLEAVFQSIYDDCSVLLLTVQSVRDSDPSQEKSYAYEYIDALSSSLSSNLRLVVQTLDSLLSVGHDQAEMALGEYTGSIDWRMSRISTRHLVDSAAIHGAEALAVRDAFGNHNGKMPEGESSYQSHNRSISNGLEGHNSFGDFTEETLVEENQPDSVIRDANSSTFFEDDRKSTFAFQEYPLRAVSIYQRSRTRRPRAVPRSWRGCWVRNMKNKLSPQTFDRGIFVQTSTRQRF